MRPLLRFAQLLAGSALLAWNSSTLAGTWSDPFSEAVLGADWQGDRDFFSIVDGALRGISATPLAPEPLHRVEVGKDWADYTVECRINVVEPNLLVCTKGALVLRDNGTDGYLFALHVATKTIEVYRLSDQQMLLSQAAPLELNTWHLVRADLQGPAMTFFVDDQLIGTLTDDRSLSGAAGVAVQDTMVTLFENFTVRGPDIPSNGLEVSVGPNLVLSWPSSFTNYVLKAASDLSPPVAWSTVTNTPVNAGSQVTVTLDRPASGNRFYMLAPKGQ